jgi:hypothetical protein
MILYEAHEGIAGVENLATVQGQPLKGLINGN